jgi:hypothetical protein
MQWNDIWFRFGEVETECAECDANERSVMKGRTSPIVKKMKAHRAAEAKSGRKLLAWTRRQE